MEYLLQPFAKFFVNFAVGDTSFDGEIESTEWKLRLNEGFMERTSTIAYGKNFKILFICTKPATLLKNYSAFELKKNTT